MNRHIQQLAQEYSGDCKTSFDELSKIIQVRDPGDGRRHEHKLNPVLTSLLPGYIGTPQYGCQFTHHGKIDLNEDTSFF